MRSRSYYAIAGSSFLLLTIACTTQTAKPDAKRADPVVQADAKADTKHDEKKAEDSKGWHGIRPINMVGIPGDDGGELHGFPEAADDGGEGTGGHPEAADGGEVEPPRPKGKDGCREGHMRFDGKCMSKDRVSKILDKRADEAMAKVKEATKPKETAQASHDLIEQQIYQMDKAEDDLDEIIEQLQREQDAKPEPDDKKGGLP
jgi:hypothetical protein